MCLENPTRQLMHLPSNEAKLGEDLHINKIKEVVADEQILTWNIYT